jgi:hypothetical protein
MGNGGSSGHTISDNSSQVNSSITTLNNQIDKLSSDFSKFKVEVETHVESVDNSFKEIDKTISLIQYEFTDRFNDMNTGIKLIESDILTLTDKHTSLDLTNKREHWEIHQNDWRERFERLAYQDYQRLINLKLELENDLQRKAVGYLLIKDNYNDYRLKMLEHNTLNTLAILCNKLAQLKYIDEDTVQKLELAPIRPKIDCSDFWIENIPKIESSVLELYNSTSRFKEILLLEEELKNKCAIMISNFSNPDLLNPFSDNDANFSRKLFNSGIRCLSQIAFKNQNEILIKNGYNYVPDYKYPDLQKKFIIGCESAKIKLDYKLEDLNFVVNYLYNKAPYKSISSILDCSINSIYPIKEPIILEIYNIVKSLDFKYEYRQDVLTTILTKTDYKKYNKIGYYTNITFNELIGKSATINYEPIINYIMERYITNQCSSNKLEFSFNDVGIKYCKDFFESIVKRLLDGYTTLLKDGFKNGKLLKTDDIFNTSLDFTKRPYNIKLEDLQLFTNTSKIGITILLVFILEEIIKYFWHN